MILPILLFVFSQTLAWEALPSIPSGRRSQFLVLQDDGGYNYGYDTGDGNAALQSGDASNQVAGKYFFKSASGENLELKYTAGVQGFVPEGVEKLLPKAVLAVPSSQYLPAAPSNQYLPALSQYSSESSDDQANTGDSSYAFSYSTGDSSRHESADAGNNVQGKYSYQDNAGSHDLSYVAGAKTGFLVTGGSLSVPNGVGIAGPVIPAVATIYSAPVAASETPSSDGSYSFSYNAGDSARQESSDVGGNVQGRYSYQDGAGSHDLSYAAGADTGFVVTGGSLAVPNGLEGSAVPAVASGYSYPAPVAPVVPAVATSYSAPVAASETPSSDGSYSFSYNAGDSSRQESSDVAGKVQGRYSYQDGAGSHDLSYAAGADTGFVVTGGSLAVPNGLEGSVVPAAATGYSYPAPVAPAVATGYSYPAPVVPAVASGYSYPTPVVSSEESSDDQSNTGDSSYTFTIDTDDYKRHESSDASGNVQGSYSYKNSAGNHDLSFVAGSSTGFLPTGGSLQLAPGLTESQLRSGAVSSGYSYPTPVVALTQESSDDESNTGDASYSFSIDTDEYKRHESSDASGNVQGSFSYKNSVGSNDLSFVAGSSTGFLPTGGSLKLAPGLLEGQLSPQTVSSAVVGAPVVQSYSAAVPLPVLNSIAPETKTTVKLGNVVVNTYLPPSNEKKKFGFILDTV